MTTRESLPLRRWLDLATYDRYLDAVASAHPESVTVSTLFDHPAYPIRAIEIAETSSGVDDFDRQHVLLTAMHAGVEYSGANTLLAVLEWALSDDIVAARIRREMRIVLVPVPNPKGYAEGALGGQHRSLYGGDPYSGPWLLTGVEDPEINVEAAAIRRLIDELEPELLVDCHGVSYERQHMIENTGISVFGMNRPHHRDFVSMMNRAATEAGYQIDTYTKRQKTLPVRPDIAARYPRRYHTCADRITPGVYAYHHYHTLAMVIEIGQEASGFLRVREALRGGLLQWDGEAVPGFPVGRLYGEGLSGVHPVSHRYGDRRAERVSLRKQLDHASFSSLWPQIPGREGVIVLCRKTARCLKDAIDSGKIGAMPRTGEVAELLPDSRVFTLLASRPEERETRLGLNLGDLEVTGEDTRSMAPFAVGVTIPFAGPVTCRVKIDDVPSDDRLMVVRYDTYSQAFVSFPDGAEGNRFEDHLVEVTYDYQTPDQPGYARYREAIFSRGGG